MTDAAGSEAWSYEVDKTNLRTVQANERTTEGITNNNTYYLDLVGTRTNWFIPPVGLLPTNLWGEPPFVGC